MLFMVSNCLQGHSNDFVDKKVQIYPSKSGLFEFLFCGLNKPCHASLCTKLFIIWL